MTAGCDSQINNAASSRQPSSGSLKDNRVRSAEALSPRSSDGPPYLLANYRVSNNLNIEKCAMRRLVCDILLCQCVLHVLDACGMRKRVKAKIS